MDTVKIAVIGLGYVGLPLARLFSTKYTTIGYSEVIFSPYLCMPRNAEYRLDDLDHE